MKQEFPEGKIKCLLPPRELLPTLGLLPWTGQESCLSRTAMARPVTTSTPTPECLGNQALRMANCLHPWGNLHLSTFSGSSGSSYRSTLHSNPELFCAPLELFKRSITGDCFRNTSQENACSKGFIKGEKKEKKYIKTRQQLESLELPNWKSNLPTAGYN